MDKHIVKNIVNTMVKTWLTHGYTQLKHLRELNVDNCEVNSSFMSDINKITSLETLYMSYNKGLTSLCFRQLKGLPVLRKLIVSSCDLTDIDMHTINRLLKLEILDISYNNAVTDSGISQLNKLIKLRILNIKGCFKVTTAGRARMPGNVNIVR